MVAVAQPEPRPNPQPALATADPEIAGARRLVCARENACFSAMAAVGAESMSCLQCRARVLPSREQVESDLAVLAAVGVAVAKNLRRKNQRVVAAEESYARRAERRRVYDRERRGRRRRRKVVAEVEVELEVVDARENLRRRYAESHQRAQRRFAARVRLDRERYRLWRAKQTEAERARRARLTPERLAAFRAMKNELQKRYRQRMTPGQRERDRRYKAAWARRRRARQRADRAPEGGGRTYSRRPSSAELL
jgi:hypothetical protein